MTTLRVSRCTALCVLLFTLSVSSVWGQATQSGVSGEFHDQAGMTHAVPPGLDDTLQSTEGLIEPGPEIADERETDGASEAALEYALWEQLADLDIEQRANAVIGLELYRDAPAADRETAATIESLWNGGKYEPAIEALQVFENAGGQLGLGIDWQVPQPIFSRGLDVRLGGTRDTAQALSLDFDEQNGNLFSVIRWGSQTGTAAWTMNISTDDGATWSETYSWTSSVGIIDVVGAVVDDYVYVGYVAGDTYANDGRMRRCLVSTGAVDSGYGFYSVIDAGTNTIKDVAIATNAEDLDNRVYYLAIQSNGVLRYYWDVASDGTTFANGGSPAVANANFGLDATWDNNIFGSSCGDFLFVSYAGTDGDIHVLGRDETSWTDWNVENATGSYRTTAISAYADTIICAFEYPFDDGTGIRYRISYNCGDSWSPGSLAIPDGSTVFGYFEPDVDARNGNGTAIIYQAEAGVLDPMYYRTREGFAPGAWSDPGLFSDYDVFTGSDTVISYLPPLAGEIFSHGAIYISLDPDYRTPYFDRPGAGSSPCDDTTPPIIEIDEPLTLTCACDLVDIVGSVGDPDGTYAGDQLEYRRRNDAAWTVADTALGARSGVLYTWDTSALVQDFYYVRVVGINECALTASDSTFVYKSTTFGSLELRAPVDGEIYGGTVCVDGTAWSQSCFDHYTVDYSPAGAGTYSPVDPPSSPYTSTVINDPLASWDTLGAVPDGDYDIRLQGVTDCGDTATEVHTITVDNTSPVADISSPLPCEYVTGLVNIYGTAADANLSQWRLYYTGDGVSGWVTIGSGSSNVNNGLLGRWDTTGLPHCAYTLRLLVWDQAKVSCTTNTHRSEYLVSVNVGCPSDIDHDGDIDLSDLAELLAHYGETCP